MLNIVAWRLGDDYLSVVFPRRRHRPSCYHAEGAAQRLVSPGALDMAGLIITPREEDFLRLDTDGVLRIYDEVSVSSDEMKQIIEWLAALCSSDGTEAFLGTQGYIWDTQSDMFMCLVGAIIATVVRLKFCKTSGSSQ